MSDSQTERFDLAVVGAGGAGTMAHLRGVLNRDRSVIFLGDAKSRKKGRATWVFEVDNIPGMHGLNRPITSTSASTLEWIASQPELAELSHTVKAAVSRIEPSERGFVVRYSERKEERSLLADFVILATGVMDVQPEIRGSIQPILPFANRGDVLY
ncbi:MAG: hypothetical protein ACE5F1_21385 [Planctomycetota bacterium]